MALLQTRNQMAVDPMQQLIMNQMATLQNQMLQLRSPQQVAKTTFSNEVQTNQIQCYKCKGIGHMSKECTSKTDGSNKFQCYKCNGVGHVSRDCVSKTPVTPQASNGIMNNLMFNVNGLVKNTVERTPCVWVTGLSEEYQNADVLANIFGNYGNVRRISFTKKQADGALIEMDTSRRADNCIRYMNNVRMGGKLIMVRPSKIEQVFVRPNDDKGSKDFKGARVGRFSKDREGEFKGQDSKFTRIIMRRLSEPTTIILVSNIPEGKPMNDVKKYIAEAGHTIKEFEEGKPREPKAEDEKVKTAEKATPKKVSQMVFVQLESPEEAISVVGKLHNTKPAKWGEIEGYRGLKFSFTSRRDMKPLV